MEFKETSLPGAYIVTDSPFTDLRGSFTRLYCQKEFERIGFRNNFVQMNLSKNFKKATFRGLHFQKAPYQDAKLIRCLSGRVMDVVVDLRPSSNTFLKNIQVELSSQGNQFLLLPAGVAHGFITLEDNSSLLYCHTEFYRPEADCGVRYDDPLLGLHLPIQVEIISEKDKSYSLLPIHFNGKNYE